MEAIHRGQADCSFAAPEWLAAFSLADVARTIVDVPIGSQFAVSVMTFNKDRWDGLSDTTREAFLRNMPVALASIIDAYVEREEKAVAEAHEAGVTFTELDGEYAAKFDEFMKEYHDQVLRDAATRGIENPEEIVDAFLANLEKWENLVQTEGTENYADLLWQEVFSKVEG